eukprot:5745184-Pyramimonas_sp.AAC.1
MQRNSHRVPQRHGAHCDTYTCSLRIVMHVQHVAFLSNQSYASKSGIEARHRSREIVPGTHPNELAEGSKPRGMAIGLSLICVEYEYAMHKAVYFFVTRYQGYCTIKLQRFGSALHASSSHNRLGRFRPPLLSRPPGRFQDSFFEDFFEASPNQVHVRSHIPRSGRIFQRTKERESWIPRFGPTVRN